MLIENQSLILNFPDCQSATAQWLDRNSIVQKLINQGLAGQVERLRITVRGEDFIPPIKLTTIYQAMLITTDRISRHQNLMKGFCQMMVPSVSLHDAKEGFTFLDVQAPLSKRLNKPKEEIVGKPLSIVAPAISEPREHYLKKVLASGQTETFEYTYEDFARWRFLTTIIPLYGTEELLVVTRDHDKEPWQLGYWLNELSPSN